MHAQLFQSIFRTKSYLPDLFSIMPFISFSIITNQNLFQISEYDFQLFDQIVSKNLL